MWFNPQDQKNHFVIFIPGNVTLVIEPVTAVITDQVKSLQSKGIDAVALGNSAGVPHSNQQTLGMCLRAHKAT